MLLYGREHHFPDAWIQVGRFAGTDKARILDHRELHGYPVSAIEEALTFIRDHLRRGTTIGAARCDREADYRIAWPELERRGLQSWLLC